MRKKAEKLAEKLKKKEEKRLAKQQHRAKHAATAPAALAAGGAANGAADGDHQPPKVVKKKKAEPKGDLAVRIVNEDPDTEETIKAKLALKLLVRRTSV